MANIIIEENYKSTECVSKMSASLKNQFFEIVNVFGPKLSDKVNLDNSIFTPHTFNEHCYDIYKIISEVMLDKEIAFGETSHALTDRELFLLNLSVLFHDISMSNDLLAERADHSIRSAEFLEEAYKENDILNSAIKENELDALKVIITAHSNIKTEAVKDSENGLKSPNLRKEYFDKDGKPIRVRILAAILRVADELDITSERLGNVSLERDMKKVAENFKKSKDDEKNPLRDTELKKIEKCLESLEHWKKLRLFSKVRRSSSDNRVIELVVNDCGLDRAIKDGAARESLINDIVNVYNTVKEKLDEAVALVFDQESAVCVLVRQVKIFTADSELDKEIKKQLSTISFDVDQKEQIGSVEVANTEVSESNEIEVEGKAFNKVIDDALSKTLTEEIEKRELLSFGHYILNSKYCARDWVDTKELVETRRINNDIVKAMSNHLKTTQNDDYCIVGVGLVGTIIASRLAFILQKPLSYFIPEKEEKNSSVHEKLSELAETTNVILVIDVVVTYESLERLIQKHNLQNKVLAIYSILFRKSKTLGSSEWLKKTFYLNDEFDIELFDKNECKYKDRCKAKNRTINTLIDS